MTTDTIENQFLSTLKLIENSNLVISNTRRRIEDSKVATEQIESLIALTKKCIDDSKKILKNYNFNFFKN